jgi:hypothetical protein
MFEQNEIKLNFLINCNSLKLLAYGACQKVFKINEVKRIKMFGDQNPSLNIY